MRRGRLAGAAVLIGGAVLAGAILIGGACSQEPASLGEARAYRERAGTLARADTTAAVPRGRYALSAVRLTSSTGLVTTGRLLRPTSGICHPGVLLQNGREENSAVIGRLPEEFGDIVVLALDYPDAMPMAIQLGDVVKHSDRLHDAAREIPARLLLGADYLASRTDTDSSRLAIAATSFAVPFATIAAAAEPRFRDVALIYGAGDLPRVLAANLDLDPSFLRQPAAWLAMRPFAEFAPERFIRHIAPRPLIMVNGIDDPQMPVDAVRSLYAAARDPKELIWMRTGHLMPTDSALIRALVDTALARMPVLQDSVRTRCVAS